MSKDPKSEYYDAGGIETLDIIKAKLTPEQLAGYYLGNVIKYACRVNHKGCAVRDIEKLATYSAWLKELTEALPKQSVEKGDFSEDMLNAIIGDASAAVEDSDTGHKDRVLGNIIAMCQVLLQDRGTGISK